ncbi:MAG TPA: glycosyltransferase [Thermoanaerobaculia bacterium]|nr:glycosyltransferase [Thermoanaerobaculia bacterium]
MSGAAAGAREPVQSLWIGPRLSTVERLAIASFLDHGHPFHLYVYREPEGVPAGAELCDAAALLPESEVFEYRDQPSPSAFSNLFRYRLLAERGGWWVDSDVVCLAPFDFAGEEVLASERVRGRATPATAAIRLPAGSALAAWAFERAAACDRAEVGWGEIGPRLFAEGIERFGLADRVQPPEAFCPLAYDEWERALDPEPPPLPSAARALHLWNEMWRRAGRDKDAAAPAGSLLDCLIRRHLDSAEAAPTRSGNGSAG